MEGAILDYVVAYIYGLVGASAYVLFIELRMPQKWDIREDILYALLGGFLAIIFYAFGTRDPAALILTGYFSISLAHPTVLSKILYNELKELIESYVVEAWKKIKEEEEQKQYGS